MARTHSNMLPLGTAAPDFSLPNVNDGSLVSLKDFADRKALLVVFLCNHCPYVVHVREELARIAKDYAPHSVGFVGITSNDVEEYPDDSPEATRELTAILGFPVLYDETQAVAKAYTAACTPDFYLFGPEVDGKRSLVYRGRLDSTRPRQDPPNGADLRAAIDSTLEGKPVEGEQFPSLGCNIKWKVGNEPDYFKH